MGGHTNSSSSFFTPLTTGVSASFFLDCGCSALCFADAISARHGIALFSCDPNPGKSSCDCDTHGHARRKVSALRLELLEIGFSLSPKTTTRKPADSASVSSFVHADPRTWALHYHVRPSRMETQTQTRDSTLQSPHVESQGPFCRVFIERDACYCLPAAMFDNTGSEARDHCGMFSEKSWAGL